MQEYGLVFFSQSSCPQRKVLWIAAETATFLSQIYEGEEMAF